VETVGIYPDLISAELARSLLEAEGIDAAIPEENIAGIDWQWSTALQGIRLQVAPEDVEAATELLETPVPPETPADDAAPHCPQCDGELMPPGRWRRRGKAWTMLLPLLILLWPLVLLFGPTYECIRCGRLWRTFESVDGR
jgi:hypothetical protein